MIILTDRWCWCLAGTKVVQSIDEMIDRKRASWTKCCRWMKMCQCEIKISRRTLDGCPSVLNVLKWLTATFIQTMNSTEIETSLQSIISQSSGLKVWLSSWTRQSTDRLILHDFNNQKKRTCISPTINSSVQQKSVTFNPCWPQCLWRQTERPQLQVTQQSSVAEIHPACKWIHRGPSGCN